MKQILMIMISTAVLLYGCGSEKRKNYIVWIDNSSSLTNERVNTFTSVITKSILPNLGPKDKLTVLFLDKCTVSKADRIYNLDLAQVNFSSPNDGINHQDDSVIVRFKKFITDSVSGDLYRQIMTKRASRTKGCNAYTDIISAVCLSKNMLDTTCSFRNKNQLIANDAKGEDNYEYENCIMFFSDMINDDPSGNFCFNKMQNLSNEQIEELFQKAEKENLVPSLKKTKVFVFGSTCLKKAEDCGQGTQQINNIKYFWSLYFKASTGAPPFAYDYDIEKEIREYASTR